MKPARRRWWSVGAAVAVAVAAAVTAGAQPSAAHDSTSTFWRIIYNDGRQCILAGHQQNHGRPGNPVGSDLGRYASTISEINPGCQPFAQPAGRIAERGNTYMNGRPCQTGGWVYSTATSAIKEWSTSENLALLCGAGWATHDVYSAVWNPWTLTAIYADARPFPSTFHDYQRQ